MMLNYKVTDARGGTCIVNGHTPEDAMKRAIKECGYYFVPVKAEVYYE